jgi:hypothetical protein
MSTDSPPYPYICHLPPNKRVTGIDVDIRIWLAANAKDYSCYSNGYSITDVSLKHIEDLVAFKLKFGV